MGCQDDSLKQLGGSGGGKKYSEQVKRWQAVEEGEKTGKVVLHIFLFFFFFFFSFFSYCFFFFFF